MSYRVLAIATHDNHGYQREEMQDMVSAYLGCSVKVHRLIDTQFIIFALPSVRFDLKQWKTENMSTLEKLPFKGSVYVTEIPAHLCTSKVISFILSPYCVVETEDGNNQSITTSEKFKCTAWTNRLLSVPKRIMACLFVNTPQQQNIDENYGSMDLRITQLLIDATFTETASHSTGENRT
jgi:hypothetical protein